MRKITIAIDGHSSCGKSTMAKGLAKKVGYIYVDTGAMYRAVTLFAMRNNLFNGTEVDADALIAKLDKVKVGFILDKQSGLPHVQLCGEDVESEIRNMEVSSRVSMIAVIPEVRTKMVVLQQEMGKEKGIVMDGRDIGTTVFPDAELKIFVTASAEIRARRRYDELKAKGDDVNYEDILKNVVERDYIDSHREVSPLRKADDALELDNSNMTIEEQNLWLMEKFNEATNV